MKITTKTTRAELIEALNEAEERALGSYHELIEVRGQRDALRHKIDEAMAIITNLRSSANATVNSMGDNNPWKLAGLALIAGIVIGWIGNGVL